MQERLVRSAHVALLAFGVFSVLSLESLAQQRPSGGTPVGGLTPAQQLAFREGSLTFAKRYTIADGLGPVFNDDACSDCHQNGGGSNRRVSRFGRVDRIGAFDALPQLGGSLIQSRGIGSITTADGTHEFVGERVPAEATVTTERRSQPLLGLGFVDAVPDDTWRAIARAEREVDPSTAGRMNMVRLTSGGVAVGKFGWKAQVATLMEFAGDALLNELGITNPLFRDESCPQGDCLALDFNPTPAMNDDGRDVEALNDFMTMLASPARGPITDEAIDGEQVFMEIGCAHCHTPTLRTGPSAVSALNRVDFHPFSDFLLHDMGPLGDGIVQGQATGREMRTQPLWGLRTVNRFMHDGATRTLEDAIRRHGGQAQAARDRFVALAGDQVSRLLAFLRSL
jgi:CxxC motif-containing protein (DUF1111 family)